MYRAIYVSTTRMAADHDEIDDILDISRRNNVSRGLTGLLIFDGKRFLQYLEGGEAAVRTAIDTIRADKRHYAMVVLSEKAVARRQFSDWAMAGYRVTGGESLPDCVRSLTKDCDPHVTAELVAFASVRDRAA